MIVSGRSQCPVAGPPPDVRRVLAVVAHPDDESFGLGAVVDRFTAARVPTSVLCFTHGEASTLGGDESDLAATRGAELRAAGAVLGVASVTLLAYPDGHLDRVPVDELAGHVCRLVAERHSTHLLVFDRGGVTGHPDHRQATRAALAAARRTGCTVLGWTLPAWVAGTLNHEFGASFVGRPAAEIDDRLRVTRGRQRRAIAAHGSQSVQNPVLYRRLALLGDREYLRVLYRPGEEADRTR